MRHDSEQILEHLRHLMHGLNETLEKAYTEHGLNLVVTLLDDRTNGDYSDCFVQQVRIRLVTELV